MAWTSTDLANIEAAIKEGVTSVSVGGRTVSYQNLDELKRIRDLIRGELGQVTHGGITFQKPYHSKGFC